MGLLPHLRYHPEMRTIVEQLDSLFQAYGYGTEARRERVSFEDVGALARVTQMIVAGRAQAITERDVTQNQPNFVVVDDNSPAGQLERISALCRATESAPQLLSVSRFIDRLWHADIASQWAQRDSEFAEDTSLPAGMSRPERAQPIDRYADQQLVIEKGGRQGALTYALNWLAAEDSRVFVILAEAGLGKSEFTRVLQWRAAIDYANHSVKGMTAGLPAVLLRVRLRDLGSLTLDAIVEYMRTTVGLERVPNAQVLTHLLCYGRLALLLDGLDELDAPRSEVVYGLEELQQVSSSGGHILLTSRSGFARTEAPIRTALHRATISELQPLDEPGAIEMLEKYGALSASARTVYRTLPARIRGVPLFLLWGQLSGHMGGRENNAETLLEMIRQFCKREEARLLLSAPEQMKLLGEVAYYSTAGSLSVDDAIILCGDENSRFVQGPHALLQLESGNLLQFRYAPFADLFLARGVNSNWVEASHAGPARFRSWLQERVGERPLQPLACEFLTDLIGAWQLTEAWQAASEAPLRYHPWVRRNILALAVEAVGRHPSAHEAGHRAQLLAELLGNRDLVNCVAAGLTLEMFDFRDWDLRGLKGNAACFAFCSFAGARVDEGLHSAQLESCRGLPTRAPEEERLRIARQALQRTLRPFQNRAVSRHTLHPRIAHNTPGLDLKAVDLLRRHGFVTKEQRERGAFSVILTDSGRLELQEFLENPTRKASDKLAKLLEDMGA